jgi:hypothetical protein
MEQLEILLEAVCRTVPKKQLMVKPLSVAFFPSKNKESEVSYSGSPQRVTGFIRAPRNPQEDDWEVRGSTPPSPETVNLQSGRT